MLTLLQTLPIPFLKHSFHWKINFILSNMNVLERETTFVQLIQFTFNWRADYCKEYNVVFQKFLLRQRKFI